MSGKMFSLNSSFCVLDLMCSTLQSMLSLWPWGDGCYLVSIEARRNRPDQWSNFLILQKGERRRTEKSHFLRMPQRVGGFLTPGSTFPSIPYSSACHGAFSKIRLRCAKKKISSKEGYFREGRNKSNLRPSQELLRPRDELPSFQGCGWPEGEEMGMSSQLPHNCLMVAQAAISCVLIENLDQRNPAMGPFFLRNSGTQGSAQFKSIKW